MLMCYYSSSAMQSRSVPSNGASTGTRFAWGLMMLMYLLSPIYRSAGRRLLPVRGPTHPRSPGGTWGTHHLQCFALWRVQMRLVGFLYFWVQAKYNFFVFFRLPSPILAWCRFHACRLLPHTGDGSRGVPFPQGGS